MVNSVKSTVPDGKTYMVPMSTNMGVFWYRTDWFKEKEHHPAGDLGPVLRRGRRKLTDKAQNRYGFTIRGGAGSIAQALEVVYGQSGIKEMFDAAAASRRSTTRATSRPWSRLAGLFKTATPEADATNDYAKMVAQFDGGSIAVMQHNLGSYNDHVKTLGADKVAALPVFRPADGAPRAVLSNPIAGIGLFASGEKKDAALAFATFAASKAMNSYWADKTGVLPANTEVNSEPWIKERQHISAALDVLNDPATTVVQMPYYLPEFNAITKTDAEPNFQKVLLGELPAKDFLDGMATALTEAQAKYKQAQRRADPDLPVRLPPPDLAGAAQLLHIHHASHAGSCPVRPAFSGDTRMRSMLVLRPGDDAAVGRRLGLPRDRHHRRGRRHRAHRRDPRPSS